MVKNTQANVTYSNEVFKQYVLKLSTNLVWKNQALANASESSDVYDRYRSEIFLLANQGRLVFSVVRSFPGWFYRMYLVLLKTSSKDMHPIRI